jgi:hypothetical protein
MQTTFTDRPYLPAPQPPKKISALGIVCLACAIGCVAVLFAVQLRYIPNKFFWPTAISSIFFSWAALAPRYLPTRTANERTRTRLTAVVTVLVMVSGWMAVLFPRERNWILLPTLLVAVVAWCALRWGKYSRGRSVSQ